MEGKVKMMSVVCVGCGGGVDLHGGEGKMTSGVCVGCVVWGVDLHGGEGKMTSGVCAGTVCIANMSSLLVRYLPLGIH